MVLMYDKLRIFSQGWCSHHPKQCKLQLAGPYSRGMKDKALVPGELLRPSNHSLPG